MPCHLASPLPAGLWLLLLFPHVIQFMSYTKRCQIAGKTMAGVTHHISFHTSQFSLHVLTWEVKST